MVGVESDFGVRFNPQKSQPEALDGASKGCRMTLARLAYLVFTFLEKKNEVSALAAWVAGSAFASFTGGG